MAHKTVCSSFPQEMLALSAGMDAGIAKPDLQKRALVNCIMKTISGAVSKKVALAVAECACS